MVSSHSGGRESWYIVHIVIVFFFHFVNTDQRLDSLVRCGSQHSCSRSSGRIRGKTSFWTSGKEVVKIGISG